MPYNSFNWCTSFCVLHFKTHSTYVVYFWIISSSEYIFLFENLFLNSSLCSAEDYALQLVGNSLNIMMHIYFDCWCLPPVNDCSYEIHNGKLMAIWFIGLSRLFERMHHFKEIFEKLSTLMYVKLWSIWCGFYMTSANMFAIGFLWPLFHLWLWILIMAVCRDVDRESFFLLLRWTAFVFIQHFHRITHVSCFQLTDVDVLWTREFNAQHGFLTI